MRGGMEYSGFCFDWDDVWRLIMQSDGIEFGRSLLFYKGVKILGVISIASEFTTTCSRAFIDVCVSVTIQWNLRNDSCDIPIALATYRSGDNLPLRLGSVVYRVSCVSGLEPATYRLSRASVACVSGPCRALFWASSKMHGT